MNNHQTARRPWGTIRAAKKFKVLFSPKKATRISTSQDTPGNPQQRGDLPAPRPGEKPSSQTPAQAGLPSSEPGEGLDTFQPGPDIPISDIRSTHSEHDVKGEESSPTKASDHILVPSPEVVIVAAPEGHSEGHHSDPPTVVDTPRESIAELYRPYLPFLESQAQGVKPHDSEVIISNIVNEPEQEGNTDHDIHPKSQEEDSSAGREALPLETEEPKYEQPVKATLQQVAPSRAFGKLKALRVFITSRKEVSGPLRRSIKRDDAVILVMGGVGTGKSTFINALMDEGKVAVGDGLKSHTEAVTPYEVYLPDRTRVVVADSPGFGDTHKSELEILELIVTWLSKLYDNEIRLTGILFFHRISDNCMAGSSLKNFNLLRALSGNEAAENTVLVTSMWDIVDYELANKREKDITENFWKPAIDNKARLARFFGEPSSALRIIGMFDLKSRVVMQVQREIIEKRLRLSETAAGSIISSHLAQIEKDQLKELEAARAELARAQEQGDQGMSEMATEELRRVNKLRIELDASKRRLEEQKAINSGVFGRFGKRALQNWLARRQNSANT